MHDPDGRSWTARENLVDILERELLGPANGPEEILDGVPDTAYLIGRIAPVRLRAGHDDPTEADQSARIGSKRSAGSQQGSSVSARMCSASARAWESAPRSRIAACTR